MEIMPITPCTEGLPVRIEASAVYYAVRKQEGGSFAFSETSGLGPEKQGEAGKGLTLECSWL